MRKTTWMQWVFAAIVVVLLGAFIASAEERIEVRVEADGGDEISVDVNGVTEVVRLDDLADGESRTFDVGEHELVVKRVGDNLTIVNDGHAFGSFSGLHEGLSTNIWVTDEGENIEIDGERRMIMVKAGGCEDCDEGDCEGHANAYTIHVDGDDVMLNGEHLIEIDEIIESHGGGGHGAVFISEDGNMHHPSMMGAHQWHSDMVTYRCEESGSTLMVKKDDAFEDVYICPATGCVMTKVEEPELRLITIQKTVKTEDED